jgi:hypothetical protein
VLDLGCGKIGGAVYFFFSKLAIKKTYEKDFGESFTTLL